MYYKNINQLGIHFKNTIRTYGEENKTIKHLKHAVGKIILVVFGILNPLQRNNCNENKKTRTYISQKYSLRPKKR